MADVSYELMQRNNPTADDIAWLVPPGQPADHRRHCQPDGSAQGKVMINIQKFGNTTAATVPLCLWRGKEIAQRRQYHPRRLWRWFHPGEPPG